MKTLRKLVRKIVVATFDALTLSWELPRALRTNPVDHSDLADRLMQEGTTHLALIAPHPTQILEFPMRHLVGALVKHGYAVVLLTANTNSASWLKDAFPQVRIADRRTRGRDFGAWKDVIISMAKNGDLLSNLKSLLIVNDSMYWNAHTDAIVAEMKDAKENWACLYESFSGQYHAQSFMVSFGNEVLSSRKFIEFWRRYVPLNTRTHSITHGELALSRMMSRSFGPPYCLLSSSAFADRAQQIPLSELGQALMALDVSTRETSKHKAAIDHILSLIGELPFEGGNYTAPDKIPEMVVRHELAVLLSEIIEMQNPTHAAGLLANRLWMTPLKRDLALRGKFTIGDVIRLAKGYSDKELENMEYDIKEKRARAPCRGVARLLFDAGRI